MLTALIGPVTSILERVIPDTDLRERLAHVIATMSQKHAQESALAQMEISKVEAGHKSLWVSGWRPGAAWVCVAAMAYNFLLLPIILFGLAVSGYETAVPLPEIQTEGLMTMLASLLGLGSMRSFEKVKKIIPS